MLMHKYSTCKKKVPVLLELQEAERETPLRKKKRQDPAVRTQEAARETPLRRQKRTVSLQALNAIQTKRRTNICMHFLFKALV
jgi:hypothetical protein